MTNRYIRITYIYYYIFYITSINVSVIQIHLLGAATVIGILYQYVVLSLYMDGFHIDWSIVGRVR